MKKCLIALLVILMAGAWVPAEAAGKRLKRGASTSSEASVLSKQWWLLGRVSGGGGEVITVKLVTLDGSEHSETSTNKFGHFAFSNSDKGAPSQYKLMIYAGDQFVREVGLSGVRYGGRVPDIRIR